MLLDKLQYVVLFHPARLEPEEFARWAEKAQTPSSFMKAAEEQTFGTNMAFFIGQGSLREKVLGYSDAAPTKEQMEIMQKDLVEAMEAGYLGVSSGLVYAPSVYASTEELFASAKRERSPC